MAAVICKTLNEIISAACRAVCIPFKVLNLGCESLGDVMKSPFLPYLAVTFGLNLPSLVYAIRTMFDWCSQDVSSWLTYNGMIAIIHMAAAMYITKTIRASNDSTVITTNQQQQAAEEGQYYNSNFSTPKADQPGAPNSCQRMKHVLCYDKVVAVYLVIFIGWVFWLSIGISRRLNSDGSCGGQEHFLGVAIACGYAYICLVGVSFAFSLCCLR